MDHVSCVIPLALRIESFKNLHARELRNCISLVQPACYSLIFFIHLLLYVSKHVSRGQAQTSGSGLIRIEDNTGSREFFLSFSRLSYFCFLIFHFSIFQLQWYFTSMLCVICAHWSLWGQGMPLPWALVNLLTLEGMDDGMLLSRRRPDRGRNRGKSYRRSKDTSRLGSGVYHLESLLRTPYEGAVSNQMSEIKWRSLVPLLDFLVLPRTSTMTSIRRSMDPILERAFPRG